MKYANYLSALTKNLNPSSNILPNPDFISSGPCTKLSGQWSCANPCVTSALSWPVANTGQSCTTYILSAINQARMAEHLRAMVLPRNWNLLTIREQLFVVVNLERTARGLRPYLGLNTLLNAAAQRAAASRRDPSIAPGFAIGTDQQGYPGMGGAWSAGFSVLAADFYWMYADGWGGTSQATSNIVCTSGTALGCWSHRDELLGSAPHYNPGVGLLCAKCEVGTGYAVVDGSGSYVVLIELPRSKPPTMVFTWKNNVLPYL